MTESTKQKNIATQQFEDLCEQEFDEEEQERKRYLTYREERIKMIEQDAGL